MKNYIATCCLALYAVPTFAVDLLIAKDETKIIYKKDLEGGVFLRIDSLVIEQGGKLIIGEPIDNINVHIKSLDAAANTEINLSGRVPGNDGAIGSDNNQQASYCHAGPSGGNGGNGGRGQSAVNAAMLIDVKRIDGLTISLNGAAGGKAGAGGRGGIGGGAKNSKLCGEGDGGWGGAGGTGGQGGNAGELHFRWRNSDPTVCWGSANDRPPKLKILQNAGGGGAGGAGGAGGPGKHQGSTGPGGGNGSFGSPGYLKVERIPSVDDAGICKV
ncbi:hypothetical protein DM05_3539 [Pseudomonas poae]|uniref:Collagen-like protein n=1 Tax=Pseudomonas poae TaxID=200451 RepID=A0A7Z1K0Y7_9PSED|nr:hypothetical protein [Pseudomonas poae]PFG58874.1 hypothetical protein DM05_3539 [Pseudomonas poae]